MDILDRKLLALRKRVRSLGKALVAFSGGVDSTLLLKVCGEELGSNAIAVTAYSPAVSGYELDDARKLARKMGARHIVLRTTEIYDRNYAANAPDRCYHCRKNMYGALAEVGRKTGISNILDGANADDVHDYRPGMKAAGEAGVLSPLKDAKLTKKEVIALAKRFGLPNWDKPSSPCLASRIPYGIPITKKNLGMIGEAEHYLRGFGLRQLRVRYHNDCARIEVEKKHARTVLANSEKIRNRLRAIGFRYVTLDLGGFRSGNLNENLTRSRS